MTTKIGFTKPISEKDKKRIIEINKKSVDEFFKADINLSTKEKQNLLLRFKKIKENVPLMHSSSELIYPAKFILSIPKEKEGCIVETGCYKGGSTAKLSIIANIVGRKLYVLDSFEGMPKEYVEGVTKTESGYSVDLKEGDCTGTLKEVEENIRRYGEIDSCEFIKGWYKDTLPKFKKKIVVVFCDVDFVQSTMECLKYLYPQIVNGGYFFTQDIHFPKIRRLFDNDNFWRKEVGVEKPILHKLTSRLGYFIKGKENKVSENRQGYSENEEKELRENLDTMGYI